MVVRTLLTLSTTVFAVRTHTYRICYSPRCITHNTGIMPTTRSRTKRLASSSSSSGSPRAGREAIKKSRKSRDQAKNQENETSHAEPWFTAFTKGDDEYDAYMSTEWGFEKRGDVALFEKLSLEGAQSGLSWLTILRKRDAYRNVFHDFDPVRVAAMLETDVERILAMNGDPREIVVRHSGKIKAVLHNAKCILKMREESPSGNEVFDKFLWSFVNDKPILNRWTLRGAPSKSPESEAMSKALKKCGFKFVGPTTCYALMQSMGMVIDHPVGSPEWQAAYERLKDRPGGYQEAKKVE
jgi:DNA-3-methyladenine glycosylase I